MNEKARKLADISASYPVVAKGEADRLLELARQGFQDKIIVLDDDPTGVQTVHDIAVYTDWSEKSLLDGFLSETQMFFILTNSRGFTAEETARVHQEIAMTIAKVSKQTGKEFILISRGDSTLRGHYPLETQVLCDTIQSELKKRYSGEIIVPFFLEGGRYTADNVHYVDNGSELVPAGQTEFAKDKTFGYHSSNLCEWVEEKSEGMYSKESVICISLAEIRNLDLVSIRKKLRTASDFQKIIVNALSYDDIKIFCTALIEILKEGKHFLFRTAAALPKILGGICDVPLLESADLRDANNPNGGLVIAGSHVNKTTLQLNYLEKHGKAQFVILNQHLVLDEKAFLAEQARVQAETEKRLLQGENVVVQTRRERFDLKDGSQEDQLRIALKISDAVTGIVENLTIRPAFIIAKGGITSSEIGTKGLKVKKAMVMGQILPGIPVWKTGAESKFPQLPYVIFPGNVGSEQALFDAVEKLST